MRAGYSAAAFLSAAPACTYLGLDADRPVYGGWPGALDKARVVLHEHFGDRVELIAMDEGGVAVVRAGSTWCTSMAITLTMAACTPRLATTIARGCRRMTSTGWFRCAAVTAFLEETGYRAIELPSVRGDMLIEVRPREKTFSHGGDTGDLIYALPTVKMLGGGRLRLVKAQQVREPFTPAKVESLRPLLEGSRTCSASSTARKRPDSTWTRSGSFTGTI